MQGDLGSRCEEESGLRISRSESTTRDRLTVGLDVIHRTLRGRCGESAHSQEHDTDNDEPPPSEPHYDFTPKRLPLALLKRAARFLRLIMTRPVLPRSEPERADTRVGHAPRQARRSRGRRRVRQAVKGVRVIQGIHRLVREGRGEASGGPAGEVSARGKVAGEDVSLVGRVQAHSHHRERKWIAKNA